MKLKKKISGIAGVLMLSCYFSLAQNLVPNYSFEDTIACPVNDGEINKAKYWFQPVIFLSSSDYFNGCSPSVNVPNNSLGYQQAKTGVAFAGIIGYSNQNYREYIEVKLISSLLSNKKYCLEYYTSLANVSKYASNGLSAHFSSDSILSTDSNYIVLPITPQVSNSIIISDTSNWILISGEYDAIGGEKFVTIGNFQNDSATNIAIVDNSAPYFIAYYYIDDVSVYEIEELPLGLAGKDTVICTALIDSVEIGLPAIAGYQYSWQNTSGITDTTLARFKVKPLQTTSYFLTVIDTTPKPYVCQPMVVDTITVFIIVATANAGTDTTICEGENTTIGMAAISGYNYNWQPAAGLNVSTISQPVAGPAQTATYVLTVSDTGNFCPSAQDSITISVVSSPSADAGNALALCTGESGNIGTAAENGYKYNWQPAAGLNNSTIAQPTATPTATTIYSLSVSDTGNYCTPATDNIIVSVQNCDTIKENIAFLPDIFSPNGDGRNDYFRVRGENIAEGELAIYNRWGERIYDLRFTKDDLNDINKWWNGTNKGKNLNTGVFVYYLKVTFEDGKTEEKKGNVTLLK